MNIFFLHANPATNASLYIDKHVGKILMEINQMLTSALHRHTGLASFKRGFAHHPMTQWVGESRSNYLYAVRLAEALIVEWHHRYDKFHGSAVHTPGLSGLAHLVPEGPMTTPPLCMPEEYRIGKPIPSYRAYYRGAKLAIARYTRRPWPDFMT